MIVLSPDHRILGTTRANARLGDERLRVDAPSSEPSGDFASVYTYYYRLCHIAVPGRSHGNSPSYLVPAVLLRPGDDPVILPGWTPR